MRDGVVTAGALVGLGAIGVALWLLWPLRADLENVRNENEVARALAAGRPDGDRDFVAVRREVDREFAARAAALAPALDGTGGASLAARVRALRAWSELKVAWARALAAHGMTVEEYRRAAPAPYDGLLVNGDRHH